MRIWVRENVLVDGDNIRLIDFDDAGFGWHMFEIATILHKNRSEPDYSLILRPLYFPDIRANGFCETRTLLPYLYFSLLEALPTWDGLMRVVMKLGWKKKFPLILPMRKIVADYFLEQVRLE